jgi:hypothetical protein
MYSAKSGFTGTAACVYTHLPVDDRMCLCISQQHAVDSLGWCCCWPAVIACRGAVQGYRQRKPDDPFFGSPFWSIAVKWDGDESDPK